MYHAKNTRTPRGYPKDHLLVTWKTKQRAWDNAALSEEWFTNHFVLAIKNNLPFQIMPISYNNPGHPNSLQVSNHTPTPFLSPNIILHAADGLKYDWIVFRPTT
jgi:cellulase/cellobiase CelA1